MKTRSILLILSLVCVGLLPKVQAVVPPPDGGYPGFNTAEGTNALNNLTTGVGNAAVGWYSLFSNTDGSFNTALGAGTLLFNIGDQNTGEGTQNTAIGTAALLFNSTGTENTAVGAATLLNNVDGSDNTAVGEGAGQNLIAGFNNTYIGDFVGTLAPDESNTIRIGDLSNGNGAGSLECFIGGIFNNFQPVGGTVVEVTLDLADDHLGWDVGPNQAGSAPVQRSATQPRVRLQHQGMLNDKIEKLQATVAQQQKQIEILTAQLKEQATQIQKVSAQLATASPSRSGLETSKFAIGRIRRGGTAPQVVNNP